VPLNVLNVGEGDVTLSFDPSNPAERKRAAKAVGDMIKQGYALLVKVGEKDGKPLYQRATAFDPETCEYIVASTSDEEIDIGKGKQKEAGEPSPTGRRTRTTRRYPASTTPAVSVARSAGG